MKLNPESIWRKIQKERARILSNHTEHSQSKFLFELGFIQRMLERGKITHKEAGKAAQENANEIRAMLDEYSEKPVDNEFYRLQDELPIYLYAAYLYYHQ